MRAIYFDASVPRVLATLVLKRLSSSAVFLPSSPVSFKDLPDPSLPGPRGIRVTNRLCGICASDLHLVYVDIDPLVHPAALPGYERIYLGHEVVSDVVEVGPETRDLAVGDRVAMKSRFLGPHCFSQEIDPPCRHCAAGNYAICANQSAGRGAAGVGGGWGDGYTCHEAEVWKVPDDITDEQAVLIEPLGCSVRAVLRRPPRPGEKVVVLGCGMIGLGVIQAARTICPEAEIYAVARHRHQIELARSYGATVVEDGDLMDAVAGLTGHAVYTGEFKNRTMLGGVDVIYDCVATQATVGRCLRMTRAGGTVVVVGVSLHRMKIDLTPVWHQEVDLIGAVGHGTETYNGESICTFDLTAQLVREQKISTEGLLTHRFPLDRWKDAIRTATDKKSGSVRVAFTY